MFCVLFQVANGLTAVDDLGPLVIGLTCTHTHTCMHTGTYTHTCQYFSCTGLGLHDELIVCVCGWVCPMPSIAGI